MCRKKQGQSRLCLGRFLQKKLLEQESLHMRRSERVLLQYRHKIHLCVEDVDREGEYQKLVTQKNYLVIEVREHLDIHANTVRNHHREAL